MLSGRITASQRRAALFALDTFVRRSHIAGITESILNRAAGAFPVEPVRTLDAIHLATAAALGEPALVIVVSRDLPVRGNATPLGHAVE